MDKNTKWSYGNNIVIENTPNSDIKLILNPDDELIFTDISNNQPLDNFNITIENISNENIKIDWNDSENQFHTLESINMDWDYTDDNDEIEILNFTINNSQTSFYLGISNDSNLIDNSNNTYAFFSDAKDNYVTDKVPYSSNNSYCKDENIKENYDSTENIEKICINSFPTGTLMNVDKYNGSNTLKTGKYCQTDIDHIQHFTIDAQTDKPKLTNYTLPNFPWKIGVESDVNYHVIESGNDLINIIDFMIIHPGMNSNMPDVFQDFCGVWMPIDKDYYDPSKRMKMSDLPDNFKDFDFIKCSTNNGSIGSSYVPYEFGEYYKKYGKDYKDEDGNHIIRDDISMDDNLSYLGEISI